MFYPGGIWRAHIQVSLCKAEQPERYLVAVYDQDWNLSSAASTDSVRERRERRSFPGGRPEWSPRRLASFSAAESGWYHVAFRASLRGLEWRCGRANVTARRATFWNSWGGSLRSDFDFSGKPSAAIVLAGRMVRLSGLDSTIAATAQALAIMSCVIRGFWILVI